MELEELDSDVLSTDVEPQVSSSDPSTISWAVKTPVEPSSTQPSDSSQSAEEDDGHVTSKASSNPPVKEEEAGSSVNMKRPRFYFESDTLALKNNPDYCQLLKTLAILEAQKMQSIRDIESLLHAQTKAESDPLGFIQALRNGTLEPLPKRQQVAELPAIEWKAYTDSLQQVAKQHSTIHLNTRRQSKALITSLDEKPVVSKPPKNPNKPESFGRQWTVEEQTKFEELLKIYPPEEVERRRFRKIAKALGTRTVQQVATHAQKYFIKLANAGLPVPGKMPNIYKKHPKKKGRGKRSLKRPSTFFSSLTPNVLMKDSGATPSATPEASSYDSSDDENSLGLELVEQLGKDGEEEEEDTSGSSSPRGPTSVRCGNCTEEVDQGVYWVCTECPKTTPLHLCNNCINSNYESKCHSPSHNMQLLSLPPPHTFFGPQESEECGDATSSSFIDKDYTNFSQNSQTGYNYLDPNFYPAS